MSLAVSWWVGLAVRERDFWNVNSLPPPPPPSAPLLPPVPPPSTSHMGYFAECYLNSGVTVGYGYVFDVVMVRFFQVMVCSHVTCFQVCQMQICVS
ncbi:hypothetical protein PVK06_016451 [Gossypium arboreum]|uniref:Uncharacterized protein n=1 Tax=Gossypium arboreum TaxID=29729 RepID=A0ABR0Q031_GOSAR|nr:hypothetical protein PVK06_016451 [Gossypium arboreum]